MPRKSPYVIDLTKGERAELEARSKDYTSPHRDVVRAKIVLLSFFVQIAAGSAFARLSRREKGLSGGVTGLCQSNGGSSALGAARADPSGD
jgi:nitrate/nitrite transporter NarK